MKKIYENKNQKNSEKKKNRKTEKQNEIMGNNSSTLKNETNIAHLDQTHAHDHEEQQANTQNNNDFKNQTFHFTISFYKLSVSIYNYLQTCHNRYFFHNLAISSSSSTCQGFNSTTFHSFVVSSSVCNHRT